MNVQTGPMTVILLVLSALIQKILLHARVYQATLVTDEIASVSIT